MNVSPIPVVRRVHPTGAAGAKVSLEATAARVRADYTDELVVAFARRTIAEAGAPRGVKRKAQALLDALRKRAPYVLDPTNAEYIASARLILCLDSTQKDLCHAGGDCEELASTFCSIAMAVGIDAILVGQSFTSSRVPTHVLAAVFDPQTEEWLKVEPSSATFPVGQGYQANNEVEVDPLTGKVPDFDGPVPAASFIGVGAPGLPQRALRRHRVLGATQASQASALGIQTLQDAVAGLVNAYFDLNSTYTQLLVTRSKLYPNAIYDTADPSITSIATLPNSPVFTSTVNSLVQTLLQTMVKMIGVGQEALNGARAVYFDPRMEDFFIVAKATDPWKLISLANPIAAAKTILGFFDAAGTAQTSVNTGGDVVSASAVAAALAAAPMSTPPTPAQVSALETSSTSTIAGPPRTVGMGVAPVVIVGLVVIGVVVASIAAYYSIKSLSGVMNTYLQEITNQDLIKCVAAGKCTPEMMVVLQKTRQIQLQTDVEKEKNDPFANALQSGSSIINAIVFGAVVIGGFVIAKEVIDRWPKAGTKKLA